VGPVGRQATAVARRWRLGIPSLGAFGDPQRERLELAEESSEPPRLLEPSAVALELLVGEVATDGLGVDLAGPVVVGAVEHGWVALAATARLTSEVPVEAVPLDSIGEIDTPYWLDGSAETPTVRKVVEHTALILEADLAYPIILGHDGRVMDGMHLVARARTCRRSLTYATPPTTTINQSNIHGGHCRARSPRIPLIAERENP